MLSGLFQLCSATVGLYTKRCTMSTRQQLLHTFLASCYGRRVMLDLQNITSPHPQPAVKPSVRIERVILRLIRLPLKEAFETSFGSIDSRLIFLVSVEA